jgi:hypothetical protein
MLVVTVISVSANMIAPVNQQNTFAALVSEPLSQNTACKAGPHN